MNFITFMYLRNAHVIKRYHCLVRNINFVVENTIRLLFRREIKKNWQGGGDGENQGTYHYYLDKILQFEFSMSLKVGLR